MPLKHVVEVPELTPAQAYQKLQGGVKLIDVRELSEWQEVHADGAEHFALSTLGQRYAELPADAEVMVICAHGVRSRQGAEFLIQQGYQASSVSGGTAAWIAERLPVIEGDSDGAA